jgi:hypothetical protein
MKMDFKNGSRVMRIWPDGSGEIIASFQYYINAVEWAKKQADKEDHKKNILYVAVCDYENRLDGYSSQTSPKGQV